MHATIAFVGFVFNLVVLAVVLGVVGYGVRSFLNKRQQSRSDAKVNSAAALARARAHARANA